jgi:hypothetical protein
MARLSTASSFFLSQIGVREFLPDININSNILTEESVVNILQSIIVKNVKKFCLSRRTLTKQKQFSETTMATCVDLISKCTTLVDLDLEGCFYLSPSQVSQLLESLPNLTRLLVSLYIYIYTYMYLYVLNSFIETSMHRKKANEK